MQATKKTQCDQDHFQGGGLRCGVAVKQQQRKRRPQRRRLAAMLWAVLVSNNIYGSVKNANGIVPWKYDCNMECVLEDRVDWCLAKKDGLFLRTPAALVNCSILLWGRLFVVCEVILYFVLRLRM